MKILGFFIALLALVDGSIDINEVRNSYKYAKKSKENTEKFYQLTKKTNHDNDHVMAAYYGCALTLKASFSEKIGDRISFFREGKKMIETAIKSDPDNIELRMIRLSVQTNAPRITRYRKNIEEDKQYLLQYIDNVSSSTLKKFIKGFMTTSEAFLD